MGRIRLFPLLFQNGCSQSSRFLPQARRIVGSGDENDDAISFANHALRMCWIWRNVYQQWVSLFVAFFSASFISYFARNSSRLSLCFALISLFCLLLDLVILFHEISSLFSIFGNIQSSVAYSPVMLSYYYIIVYAYLHTITHIFW